MVGIPVAGLDYSTKAIDLAIVRGRELLFLEEYRLAREPRNAIHVITHAMVALAQRPESKGRPVKLYIERPWFRAARPDDRSGSNNHTLDLHARAQWVVALATAAGLEVVLVHVPTWRALVLGNGRLQTVDAKRAAMGYARTVFKIDPQTHNAADAICLAAYGDSIERRNSRLVGAAS